MIFWPFKKIPQDRVENALDYLFRQGCQKESRTYFFGAVKLYDVDMVKRIPVQHAGKDICHFTWKIGRPDKISVFSCNESHHNGSQYDVISDEMDVDETFFDGMFRLMVAEVEKAIIDEVKKEEENIFKMKVSSRLANTLNCRIIG